MFRVLCLAASLCGMMFIVMPLSTVLEARDFMVVAIGFGLLLFGVFFAIGSVANKDRK